MPESALYDCRGEVSITKSLEPLYTKQPSLASLTSETVSGGGSRQALLTVFPSQIQTFSALPGNHPTPPPFYSGCLQESGLQASRCCPHLPGPFRPRQSLPPPPHPCLAPSPSPPHPLQAWGSEQRALELGAGGRSRAREGVNSPVAPKAPVSPQTMPVRRQEAFSQKPLHHTFVIINDH